MCRAVCNGLGSVIGHQEIRVNRPELSLHNGMHLSDIGLEIFLADLGGLLLELVGWWAWDLVMLVPTLWQVVWIEQVSVSPLATTGNI